MVEFVFGAQIMSCMKMISKLMEKRLGFIFTRNILYSDLGTLYKKRLVETYVFEVGMDFFD